MNYVIAMSFDAATNIPLSKSQQDLKTLVTCKYLQN